jgi:hypothetical protein
MNIFELHLFIGWFAMLLGAVSGGVIGLFFHIDGWAGGYNSFRRRMLRLAHISFFGLGFLNLMFALTLQSVTFAIPYIKVASFGFIVGAITMPLCCFLAAWKKPFRHLFPLPVAGVFAGIMPILHGLFTR